jgi:hypothetical protein
MAVEELDPAEVVWVENESNRIGQVSIPRR